MNAFPRTGIIGGSGWIGGALARAAVAAGVTPAGSLVLSYRSARPDWLPDAGWTRDNQELADRSDVVVIAVRPADWPALEVSMAGKLAISVMAGIPIAGLSSRLGTERVVRALPNAAAEVMTSYTPWTASPQVSPDDRSVVARLFDTCGTQDEVASEDDIDYMTGLSGSGPAFPALLAAAMQADAVARGLPPEVARRAVTAVLIGTGRLFEKHGDNPADLVETFVRYGGITAAAIDAMRSEGFEAIVGAGLATAARQVAALGG